MARQPRQESCNTRHRIHHTAPYMYPAVVSGCEKMWTGDWLTTETFWNILCQDKLTIVPYCSILFRFVPSLFLLCQIVSELVGALETVGPRQRAHFAGTSGPSVVEAFRFSPEAHGSPKPHEAAWSRMKPHWQVQMECGKDWKRILMDWNWKVWLRLRGSQERFGSGTQRFLKTVRCAAWGRRRCSGLKSLVFWSKIQ